MKIQVTQKHIDDAQDGILYNEEQKSSCPIALAIYEQLYGGTYSLVGRGRGFYRLKQIRFGKDNYGNRCNVLNTIELDAFSLPDLYGRNHPPINIHMNLITKKFVVAFDIGESVKPFSFVLKLPKQTVK